MNPLVGPTTAITSMVTLVTSKFVGNIVQIRRLSGNYEPEPEEGRDIYFAASFEGNSKAEFQSCMEKNVNCYNHHKIRALDICIKQPTVQECHAPNPSSWSRCTACLFTHYLFVVMLQLIAAILRPYETFPKAFAQRNPLMNDPLSQQGTK